MKAQDPGHLLAKSGSVLKMRRRHCTNSTALSDHLVTASSVGCGDDSGVGSDVDIVGGVVVPGIHGNEIDSGDVDLNFKACIVACSALSSISR